MNSTDLAQRPVSTRHRISAALIVLSAGLIAAACVILAARPKPSAPTIPPAAQLGPDVPPIPAPPPVQKSAAPAPPQSAEKLDDLPPAPAKSASRKQVASQKPAPRPFVAPEPQLATVGDSMVLPEPPAIEVATEMCGHCVPPGEELSPPPIVDEPAPVAASADAKPSSGSVLGRAFRALKRLL